MAHCWCGCVAYTHDADQHQTTQWINKINFTTHAVGVSIGCSPSPICSFICLSICLSVCPQHIKPNSKTNDPKVVKLCIENDLGKSCKYGFGVETERSKVKVQKNIGLLEAIEWPAWVMHSIECPWVTSYYYYYYYYYYVRDCMHAIAYIDIISLQLLF